MTSLLIELMKVLQKRECGADVDVQGVNGYLESRVPKFELLVV